jgi:predicted DNA-binding protein
MEKTSVYLTAAERRRLAQLAERTGRSQSAILREAIAAYEPGPRADRDFAVAAVAAVADGPASDIASIDEDELLEGFGE